MISEFGSLNSDNSQLADTSQGQETSRQQPLAIGKISKLLRKQPDCRCLCRSKCSGL